MIGKGDADEGVDEISRECIRVASFAHDMHDMGDASAKCDFNIYRYLPSHSYLSS